MQNLLTGSNATALQNDVTSGIEAGVNVSYTLFTFVKNGVLGNLGLIVTGMLIMIVMGLFIVYWKDGKFNPLKLFSRKKRGYR